MGMSAAAATRIGASACRNRRPRPRRGGLAEAVGLGAASRLRGRIELRVLADRALDGIGIVRGDERTDRPSEIEDERPLRLAASMSVRISTRSDADEPG
jgi:uncharacterized protein YjiS (DUF1127 family)